jgi:hypothetical protein
VANTARDWSTLWLDISDSLGLGAANQEISLYCTVCEPEEDGGRPHAPLFESL